jgi:hypothetical protein
MLEPHLINDDIIRRTLNFFGLRGEVKHEYQPTVLPVVVIGDLSQPAKWVTNIQVGTQLMHTVPKGETWKIMEIAGSVIQAAGATALTYGILLELASGSVITMHVPFWPRATVEVERIQRTITLNGTETFTARLPKPIYLPSEARMSINQIAGDGTITFQMHVQYQVIGERLVDFS